MLLSGGTFAHRRYLSRAGMKFLTAPQTGDLPTGFFQNEAGGNLGANYGWGIGTCVLRTPHDGVAARRQNSDSHLCSYQFIKMAGNWIILHDHGITHESKVAAAGAPRIARHWSLDIGLTGIFEKGGII